MIRRLLIKKIKYLIIISAFVFVFSGGSAAAYDENIATCNTEFNNTSDSILTIKVGPSRTDFSTASDNETSTSENIPQAVTDVDPQLVQQSNQNIFNTINNGSTGNEPATLGSSAGDSAWVASEWVRPKLPSKGTVKIGVVVLEFQDYKILDYYPTNEAMYQDINNKFFGPGDQSMYPYESLARFYSRSSYGQLDITGNIIGIATWSENRGAITSYEQRHVINEIKNGLEAAGVDLSQYDNDNDGWIDGLYILWTGPEDRSQGIWVTCEKIWSVDDKFFVPGAGKYLRTYVWAPIGWTIGSNVFEPMGVIHETGHLLGLPDLYDYTTEEGPNGALGKMDIMDKYGDHNCFSKFLLGWIQPTLIYNLQGDYQYKITLRPSDVSKDAVLIMPNYHSIFGEYFMVQNRRPAGNDAKLLGDGIFSGGLVIWHIDATMNSDYTHFLYNNQVSDHKLIRLMEADGLEEIEKGLLANAGDFYIPGKRFGPDTSPNSDSYYTDYFGTSQKVTNINVYDIVKEAGDVITTRLGFYKPISLAEALDTTGLSWRTEGGSFDGGTDIASEWYGQGFTSADGSDSAQSSTIDNNMFVWLETSVTGPGDLSFKWKVSSEQNHDFLRFYVDNALIYQISGVTNWQTVTYHLKTGLHYLIWAFEKDEADQYSRIEPDCGWLDQVKFTYNSLPPVANAGGPYSGTPYGTITLDASGSYDPDGESLSYRWDLNNDGTWDTFFSISPKLGYTWTSTYQGLIKVAVTDGLTISTDTAFVSINTPPLADAGDPYSSISGEPVLLDASKSSDADGDELFYGWDFNNDGIWDTPYSTSPYIEHTWTESYHGLIKVAVTDGKTYTTDKAYIDINAPPVADAGGPYSGVIGYPVILNADGSTDADGDELVYGWDFNNDGTWDTAYSTSPTIQHTWTESYQGLVKVAVFDGKTTYTTDTAFVKINNPPIAEAGGPYSGIPGISIILDASGSSDIDGDELFYSWDFNNDGTWDTPYSTSPKVTYTWTSAYQGLIKVLVNDGFLPDTRTDTAYISINTPPIANAGGPYTANEGSPITFNAGGSSDADGDALQYRWDFNNDGTWDAQYSSDPKIAHTWSDDYTGTVKLEVSDGVNSSTATASVKVLNVVPQVEAGSNQNVILGRSISFKGSKTDPGTLDTHTYSWNFGDGSGPVTGTLTPTHTYTKTGTFTVTLTIKDNNGGVGTDTMTVTVLTPQQYTNTINNNVQNLPNAAFVKKADQSKKTLSNMFMSLNHIIDAKAYKGAILRLEQIKTNINSIIKDPAAKTELNGMVDNLSMTLKTLI